MAQAESTLALLSLDARRRAGLGPGTGWGMLDQHPGLAIVLGSFRLSCLGPFCGCVYAAAVLSFRFAAADG
ncbi:MAG: hypothetical protein MUC89_00965 [Acetobacteraceae bacterium]|jgi:hypothetical protein|nr:hypothetical protein [Acetobacteraceae bacterium]